MDQLLPQLLAFPPVAPSPPEEYERQIKSLQHLLNTTSGHLFLEKVDEEYDLLDVRRLLSILCVFSRSLISSASSPTCSLFC
jgi:hypothetical protein